MLNKEIKLNKYLIIFLLLVYVITIGLYASYAYYEVSVIKNGVVVIQTATIDITTNVVDQENNTFTIPANSNITRTAPPAITPVPSLAGLIKTLAFPQVPIASCGIVLLSITETLHKFLFAA